MVIGIAVFRLRPRVRGRRRKIAPGVAGDKGRFDAGPAVIRFSCSRMFDLRRDAFAAALRGPLSCPAATVRICLVNGPLKAMHAAHDGLHPLSVASAPRSLILQCNNTGTLKFESQRKEAKMTNIGSATLCLGPSTSLSSDRLRPVIAQ